MSSLIVDDLVNASNGIGQSIDTASLFGTGAIANPYATVVADSKVTAGACQLQTGAVSTTTGLITWTAQGSPTNVSAGTGVALTRAGAAVQFARIVVTTPIVGGKILGVLSI